MTSAALAHVHQCSAPVMFARSSRIIDEYTPPSFSPEASPTFSFVALANEERLANSSEKSALEQSQEDEANHMKLTCSCEEMVEFLSGEKIVSSHRAGATTSVAGDWAFGAEGMMVMTNFRLLFIPFSLFSLLMSVSSRDQELNEGEEPSSCECSQPPSVLDNDDNTNQPPPPDDNHDNNDNSVAPSSSNDHTCSYRVNLTDIQESVGGVHRPRITCQVLECRKEAQLAPLYQENEPKFFTLSLPLASIYHIECRYQYQPLGEFSSCDEPTVDCTYHGPWPSQFPPEWRRETVGMFEVDCKSFRSVLFICLSDTADALSPNRLPPVFSSSDLIENIIQETSQPSFPRDADPKRRGRSVSVKTTINPKGLPENHYQPKQEEKSQEEEKHHPYHQQQEQEQRTPPLLESFAEGGIVFDSLCVSPTSPSGFVQQVEKDPQSLFALGTLYNWCPPSWHLGYLGSSTGGEATYKRQVEDNSFRGLEGESGDHSYSSSCSDSPPSPASSGSSPTTSDALFFDQFLKSLTQSSFYLEGTSHIHPSSSASSSSSGSARKKAVAAASCPEKLFAFSFTPTFNEGGKEGGWGVFEAQKEFDRLGFTPQFWKVSHLNEKYAVSPTYPQGLIVPKSVSEKELKGAAAFRTQGRLPAVVWRSRETGAVIARSSQPRTGILRSRNHDDEKLLRAVAHAAKSSAPVSKRTRGDGARGGGRGGASGGGRGGAGVLDNDHMPVTIFDCRPRLNAIANQTLGAGAEALENYPGCRLEYLGIHNIHTMRDSLKRVHDLCRSLTKSGSSKWLSSLEYTGWFQHILLVLGGAASIVKCVASKDSPTSALVHCSDGWDRTSQLVSLAELLLDPYYRTLEGFEVLIEKEWLSFGHKFHDRLGVGRGGYWDENETSPIFLQWVECVWHVMNQMPCAFEFNSSLLVFILDNLFSCLFGTFLLNWNRDRDELQIPGSSASIWGYVNSNQHRFINPFYSPPKNPVLFPVVCPSKLRFWDEYYCRYYSFHSQSLADGMKWGDQMERLTSKHLKMRVELKDLKEEKSGLEKELKALKQRGGGEGGSPSLTSPTLENVLILENYEPLLE